MFTARAATAGLLCLFSAVASAQRPCLVTDLGALGGIESRGMDVNAAGQAAGRAKTDGNLWHAYLHDAGSNVDLGTLGGSESWAYALNDAAQVVGNSLNATGRNHAFRWTDTNGNGQADPGEMIDLGTLGGWTSVGYDVNSAGQVVGVASWKSTLLSYDHAFRWTDADGDNVADPGEMQDLGTLGGSTDESTAYGIADDGTVVGKSDAGIHDHAFRYTDAGGMIDLGTLGGTTSIAYDLNAAGYVVGVSTDATSPDPIRSRAFRWYDADGNGASDPGEMIDLGALGGPDSTAYGVNAANDVVGCADVADGTPHAFVYSGGSMTDLNTRIDPTLGWLLHEARAINDVGQIVGIGHSPAGFTRGFLLTPAPDGDANLDGTVGPGDFAVVSDGWAPFATNKGWLDGDLDDDGAVGNTDFALVLANWAATAATGADLTPIPEPTILTLLAAGALAALGRRSPRLDRGT